MKIYRVIYPAYGQNFISSLSVNGGVKKQSLVNYYVAYNLYHCTSGMAAAASLAAGFMRALYRILCMTTSLNGNQTMRKRRRGGAIPLHLSVVSCLSVVAWHGKTYFRQYLSRPSELFVVVAWRY